MPSSDTCVHVQVGAWAVRLNEGRVAWCRIFFLCFPSPPSSVTITRACMLNFYVIIPQPTATQTDMTTFIPPSPVPSLAASSRCMNRFTPTPRLLYITWPLIGVSGQYLSNLQVRGEEWGEAGRYRTQRGTVGVEL